MGEGTKFTGVSPPGKFIEQINYQEIDEGEVSAGQFSFSNCEIL